MQVPAGAQRPCSETSARYSARGKRVITLEGRDGELMASLSQQAAEHGIDNGAIVSLIGAVDAFTVSTMPAADATKDILTNYAFPAEMSGTGEIVDGAIHVHAIMAVEGDRAISGHLHQAKVSTWFARAYVVPIQ
jgi:predicted DNA-binding protein with PD1-like motif